ncbi:hypothetical protein QL285_041779 [Trifolium repens]|nr:hypothetical protein QL285_041779 [Trifolium repens]
MPPKENRKVNIASKKKRMILPHRVKQVAKHAQTSAVESPIDDNATTPGQPNARHDDAELSDAGRQRSSPIVMMPTPGFVLQNTVASSPSPIIDPSPLAQPTTSISSRRMLESHDPTLSVDARCGDDRLQGSQPSHHEDEKAPDGKPYIFPVGRG